MQLDLAIIDEVSTIEDVIPIPRQACKLRAIRVLVRIQEQDISLAALHHWVIHH